MVYYRFHNFPVAADAPVAATLALVKECLGKAGVTNVPLRFCFFGSHGCAEIVAKFPELRRFLSIAGPQRHDTLVEHLSNFGPSTPGALAGPLGEVPPETIAAVAAGIPGEFPISSANLRLGPILEGSTLVRPSGLRSPLQGLELQCLSLSWQSSPTRDGQRFFLNFIETLPTAAPRQPVPSWIQTFYSAFPGASAEKIHSDVDWIMSDYQMVVSYSDGSFIGTKSIGDDLKLPHVLPDSGAASHLDYTLLTDPRGAIARGFADGGWKSDLDSEEAGTYQLRKTSLGGRSLVLLLEVQEPGALPRTISGLIQLIAARRRLTLGILAERSRRREYAIPNSQVLSQVLDNMRVAVKYLEGTWVKELEEALGPEPQDSKSG
jgi:hypothetical protein